MVSGIYQIKNKLDGKSYIGSSNNIKRRWSEHSARLNMGIHHSNYLQNAWDKYGKENFEIHILFTCPESELIRIEQYCINNYGSEYNMCKIAGRTTGIKLTEKHKRKISEAKKGSICSEELKLKISLVHKGKITPLETKLKMSIATSKPVVQIDRETLQIINYFSSIKEAQIKSKTYNISDAILGKRNHSGGFIWKFLLDVQQQ